MAHTPGPWRVFPGRSAGVQDCFYIQSAGARVTTLFVNASWDYRRVKADADLIAAAPELLEALQAVVLVADRNTAEFDLARAAIAKARGE